MTDSNIPIDIISSTSDETSNEEEMMCSYRPNTCRTCKRVQKKIIELHVFTKKNAHMYLCHFSRTYWESCLTNGKYQFYRHSPMAVEFRNKLNKRNMYSDGDIREILNEISNPNSRTMHDFIEPKKTKTDVEVLDSNTPV